MSRTAADKRDAGEEAVFSNHGIEALRQGDLDELCGLYAIVNGMRLAERRRRGVSRAESKLLFRRGLRYLERGGHTDVVRSGMPSEIWSKLASHILKYAAKHDIARLHAGNAARCELPADVSTAMDMIEKAVVEGIPVAVELQNSLNHFTVVSSITDERWILFDSFGYRWIEKRSLGSKGSGARHILGPRVVLFSTG